MMFPPRRRSDPLQDLVPVDASDLPVLDGLAQRRRLGCWPYSRRESAPPRPPPPRPGRGLGSVADRPFSSVFCDTRIPVTARPLSSEASAALDIATRSLTTH